MNELNPSHRRERDLDQLEHDAEVLIILDEVANGASMELLDNIVDLRSRESIRRWRQRFTPDMDRFFEHCRNAENSTPEELEDLIEIAAVLLRALRNLR